MGFLSELPFGRRCDAGFGLLVPPGARHGLFRDFAIAPLRLIPRQMRSS
jgi:hypothetical protein